MKTVNELILRYRSELADSVTPFWEKTFDSVNGGFFNMIDRDGSIFDRTKFPTMQWRAIYMFARLHNSKFRREGWLEKAVRGFDFCTEKLRGEDGSYPAACGEDGSNQVPGGKFNILCESYAAIAAAELFRATGEKRYRDEAASAFHVFNGRIRESEQPREDNRPTAGAAFGSRSMLRAGGVKRLGLQMHLCTTAAILYEIFGPDFEECGSILNRTLDTLPEFRHPELGRWIETRRLDGSFDFDNPMGRLIVTGHGFETICFMAHAAETAGREDILRRIPDWVDELCRRTRTPEGGIPHMEDALGRPVCDPGLAARSWWSHCEALAAIAWAWKLDGGDRFRECFLAFDELTWRYFRDPEYPEWFSFVSPRGEPLVLIKGSMLKTFFHLPRMLLVCLDCFRSIAAR